MFKQTVHLAMVPSLGSIVHSHLQGAWCMSIKQHVSVHINSNVTGFVKTCIVYTSNFSTYVDDSHNFLRITDGYETCRDCRTTIPLSFLKILNLYMYYSL